MVLESNLGASQKLFIDTSSNRKNVLNTINYSTPRGRSPLIIYQTVANFNEGFHVI